MSELNRNAVLGYLGGVLDTYTADFKRYPTSLKVRNNIIGVMAATSKAATMDGDQLDQLVQQPMVAWVEQALS